MKRLKKQEIIEKKNSFNDTEISIIYKNNDNTSQNIDIINSSNINLNESKYGTNNNYIIPVSSNSNSKGKITKGKKKLFNIYYYCLYIQE